MSKLEFSNEHKKINESKIKKIIKQSGAMTLIVGGIVISCIGVGVEASKNQQEFNQYATSSPEFKKSYNQIQELQKAKDLLDEIYGKKTKDYIDDKNDNVSYSEFKTAYNDLYYNYHTAKQERLIYKLDEEGMNLLVDYINNDANIIYSYIEKNGMQNYQDIIDVIMKDKIINSSKDLYNDIKFQKIYTQNGEKGKSFNVDALIDGQQITISIDEEMNNVISNIQNGSLEDIRNLVLAEFEIDMDNNKLNFINKFDDSTKLSVTALIVGIGCALVGASRFNPYKYKDTDKKTL